MEYLSKSMNKFVAYDEVDFTGRLKLSAVFLHYQNILELHARELGISHREMEDKGKFWIISRMRTELDFYPNASSQITIDTYPHAAGLVEAQRSFRLLDSKGQVFAKTISKWCVLDIETRKICRLAEFIKYPATAFNPDKAVEFPPRNFDCDLTFDSAATIKEFCVNISDLDINMHMNNAKYYDTILNMCSVEELTAREIACVDLSFLSELKHGDCYKVVRTDDGDYSKFEGVLGEKRIFSALVKWRNAQGKLK